MNKRKQPNPTDRLFMHFNSEAKVVSRKELAEMRLLPGHRINPLRHELFSDWIIDYLTARNERVCDDFHAVSHNEHRYLGLLRIADRLGYQEELVTCILNSNDGHTGLELHFGVVMPFAPNVMAFYHGATVARKYVFTPEEDIHLLVNENMRIAEEHGAVERDRIEAYKRFKFSEKEGYVAICKLLTSDIVAGRSAAEFISTWERPAIDYLKPRTAWSMFCLAVQFINRLRSQEIIERTKLLHDYFDSIVKFNRKATTWLRPNLI